MINSAIPINCGWGSTHPAGLFSPSVRAGRKFLNRIKLILAVQSCLKKYFGFHLPQITSRTFRIPSHTEGRFAIVTDVGAGCGGRGSVLRAAEYDDSLWSGAATQVRRSLLQVRSSCPDVIRSSINLRKKVLSKKDGSPGHPARRRAEPVIGPRFAGTRWRFRPVMTIPIGMLFEN
jgi:hypothetical protein